jgi:hypothetical protein
MKPAGVAVYSASISSWSNYLSIGDVPEPNGQTNV